MTNRLSFCVFAFVALILKSGSAQLNSTVYEESYRSHQPTYFFANPSARQDSYLEAASASASNFGSTGTGSSDTGSIGSSALLSSSYAEPSDSYGSPPTGYGAPMKGYDSPAPMKGYDTPAPTYGTPTKGYGPPMKAYGPPMKAYGPPMKAYGPPAMKAYGPPMKGYGPPMKGYEMPMGSTYHYHMVPDTKGYGYGYGGEEEEDEKGGGGKGGLGGLGGLAGLAGLAGLKGLLPLLPLLLGFLLILPLLPLLILFLPIPVVTLPVGGRSFAQGAARQFIDDFTSDKENCVERISCEISTRISRKSTVKQNLKWAIQNLDDWFDTNSTNGTHKDDKNYRSSEDSKFSIPLYRKLTRGIQDGMKALPCTVYSKCNILDSVKKMFAQFAERYKLPNKHSK